MKHSVFFGVAAFLTALLPDGTVAQTLADACIQQGYRPGSSAYHACISAADGSSFGMFDTLNENPADSPSAELPPGPDQGNDWTQQLDTLGTGSGDTASSPSAWDWSKPAK